MWRELVGTIGYVAGASGTVTVPAGACVLKIVAHASVGAATIVMFNGDAIPIVNGAPPIELSFMHTLWQSRNNTSLAGSQNIVFTNTDSYFVEFVKSGNT